MSVDMSYIGSAAYVIQFEDVVSAIGANIARFVKANKPNDVLKRMSEEDIFLSYINREEYSISKWLKTVGIDFEEDSWLKSDVSLIPNIVYTSKTVPAARDNHVSKIIVVSNNYSPIIEELCKVIYKDPVDYYHGDISEVLKQNPNCTYITSNPDNIRRCEDIGVPFVLTIVDDYMYLKDIIKDKFDEILRKKNILVYYTSVISAGVL